MAEVELSMVTPAVDGFPDRFVVRTTRRFLKKLWLWEVNPWSNLDTSGIDPLDEALRKTEGWIGDPVMGK